MDTIIELEITKIHKGRNPRTHFKAQEMKELAASIREHGLVQPIVVEPAEDGYVLVMGERRMRAHEMLKKKTIKAIVREQSNHNGRERFIHAIIENEQREDMNPIEKAIAYQTLHDEFQMSAYEISKQTGKGEKHIYDAMALLDLDLEIQEMISNGWWKDSRLVRGLMKIKDRDIRVGLAERLYKHKVSLTGSMKAVEKTLTVIASTPVTKRTVLRGEPVFGFGNEPTKPMRWDMLKQTGSVPEWSLVVLSAKETCQACSLRDIASEMNCRDCPAVSMLGHLMKVAK